ncbi:MAG TPA: CPBP family glutamic-type intramembrane protease, partial [Chlamydiales bacterium]|nr:CPBP family glutamic-type intramembrane protease [Chlamydiales bacterium]
REFDKEAALVFCVWSERPLPLARREQTQKNAAKPTSSKTDSSGCFGITRVLDKPCEESNLKDKHMTIQLYNAWSAAATGFKYLPYSLVTQAATIAVSIATGQVAWDRVKEVFFPSDSRMCDTVKGFSLLDKAVGLGGVSCSAWINGAVEEVIMRGIFQDGLLTRVPKAVLGIFGRNHWVDSRPAQVVRVSMSVAAAVALRLTNPKNLPPEKLRFLIANTLGIGTAIAAVKEKTGSVVAAIGLRSLHNVFLINIPTLWLLTNACSIFKSDPTPTYFSSSPSSSPTTTSSTPEQSVSLDQSPIQYSWNKSSGRF